MATKDSRHTTFLRTSIKFCLALVIVFLIFQVGFYFLVESKQLRTIYANVEIIRNYSGRIANKLQKNLGPANATAMNMVVIEKTKRTDILQDCPPIPTKLVGPLATYRHAPSIAEMEMEFKYLETGGYFSPTECRSDQRVAIVIPYRNRELHLRTLLYNLHAMLQRQQINYRIFVIEQAGNNTFNRGLLMNIGYTEAIKSDNYTCFVFHDVDLIPEDDRIYYGCGKNPRHLSAAIDKFNYRLPYGSIVGGVTQLRKDDVEKINGFSNMYFGWGGEDDDLGVRLKNAQLKIERYSMVISRYKMLKHVKDQGNAPNPNRIKLLKTAASRMKTDGVNNLKYKVLNTYRGKLFTNVTVAVTGADYAI
ncbi:beta-1,4-N-acetylgalactosaminyltransferase bre-4-like [Mizuhopecten yessoensis]|uniref:Beta-1,4-galactosyltransferase n=1 Tax=Mizuhopecten yessoensis TaxID=6573 RepID=A0A210Q8P1_MIZYE|nr:beta-1,4-N-acetylgalactosaminyltransferase bre-4-like [Mizuhopecten yessoensis]OWF45120.1 Beta-1,4-N-acetylgalactosaminyltransferase bre-4 [Mizuhopecten yessoensis]